MNARVLAVIVCYNPDRAALEQTLSALQEQVAGCALIDNGSSNANEIQGLQEHYPNTQFKGLAQNLGLGVAHNQGIALAKDGGFSHVLLLDQDSVPLPEMVNQLVKASIEQSKITKVCAVGARYYNAKTDRSENDRESFFIRFGKLKFQRHYCPAIDSPAIDSPAIDSPAIDSAAIDSAAIDSAAINSAATDKPYVEADFLISSGSLISLNALEDIGLMDQDLFIDHVDTEWFLRAKSMGYKAYGVCTSVMQHALGEQTHQINLGGRQRNVPQHKPFRYYYIFRNSIALYKRGYASTLWKWNDLQRLTLIFIMYGFVKAPRLANLSMMLKGVWHGLIGKLGKLDD